MSKVGQKEILTQNHVIAFFQNELGYEYLGDWKYRTGNSNVEEERLRDWLRCQGHSDKIIGKVFCMNWARRRRSAGPRRCTMPTARSTASCGTA